MITLTSRELICLALIYYFIAFDALCSFYKLKDYKK